MDDITFDLIEKYYQNELTGKDLEDFEERLTTDHDLASELEAYRQTRAAIKVVSDQRLKEILRELGAAQFDEKQLPQLRAKSMSLRLAMAASVLILVTATFLIYRNAFEKKDSATLFTQYYEVPAVDESTVRGNNAAVSPLWETALKNYQARDFKSASANFATALADSTFTQRSAANMYLGICYLETGEPVKAIDCFRKISRESAYEQQAEWYLALGHLKKNEIDQTKLYLVRIISREHHYKKKEATELMNDVE